MSRIAYLCDKTKCESACSNDPDYPCRHTSDIDHAVNFRKVGDGVYEEIDVFKIIDDLYEEMDKKSTSCTYTLDGETITTDVGYAYLGVEFFIKNLKKRLGGYSHDGT